MSFPFFFNVHFLPTLTTPEQLAGKTVVVIDVLRATTTIVQALAAGATEVIPCLEVADARRLAKKCAGPAVLGGERNGVKIDGFDLGNSPAEYTRKAVKGKSVFFTTTNGTRAMTICKGARNVFLGAFTNITVLCEVLRREGNLIEIVCAGTDGQITHEDVLLTGAIGSAMSVQWARMRIPVVSNDQANIASAAWAAVVQTRGNLREALRRSQGGLNLSLTGQSSDIGLAARIDRHKIVPELLLDEWKIVPAALL